MKPKRSFSSIILAALTLGIPSFFSGPLIQRPALNEPPPRFDKDRIEAARIRRERREARRAANNAHSRMLNPCYKPKKAKATAAPATSHSL